MINVIKKYLWDIVAVVAFVVVAYAYFFPADLDGRILYRNDSSAGRGAGQEQQQYYDQNGERTRWTNAIFSGMPTYQLAPSYESTETLGKVMDAYHLWLPENVWYVFVYLLGFYIMLRAFNYRKELAALGSVIWAFSSYFFIIIAAGHIWKVWALAYLPPLIGGIVLTYRGKFLWGFVLTALFTAFEVKANHVQMTYYYLFIVLFMVVALLVEAIKDKWIGRFVKATALCTAAAAVGICMNLSNLYHTWQYQNESMRGKSELVKEQSANQTSSGLDRDYITQWSYGIDETWTLLVPNAKGGASVPLSFNETAMKKADPELAQLYNQIGQYWGNQPGTSGPVYVGAFVMFLFILSLFIVKGPMKWALLGVTILSVLLSWGKNFMPFTDFFLDYVPMYAKFRTVASILVIAEFTIPLLAVMGLKRIVDEPDLLAKNMKWLYVSLFLTAGLAVLFALMPKVFFPEYISHVEMEALKSLPGEYYGRVIASLTAMRQAMFTNDCWRSAAIIVMGTLLLLCYKARIINATTMLLALTVLCLFDMWQVNKRYLNDEMFVEKSTRELPQPKTATDETILQDKSLDYRVLNLASNTFNENETSYYHKSIGGYHAAKLRRYAELIDAYIAPEMKQLGQAVIAAGGDMTQVNGDSLFPVLNMLNAKYFILPLQQGQTVPLQNPYVYGNAWFVDRIKYVENADQELDALGLIDLRHEAVADKEFKATLQDTANQEGESVVTLTDYRPNELVYNLDSDRGGVVVFSEIFYPGWTATIDGEPAQLGRVDYVLRALRVPAGNHEVVLTFKPASIRKTESVAYASYFVLLLAIGVGLFVEWKRRKEEK